MTDIYAEFGVNSAVMSSSDPAEHEQNMLALDVRARDGDSSIDLVDPEDETEEELEEESEEEESEEGDQEESEGDETSDEESDDFEPLGEPDEELKEASESIEKYADGFVELRNQAIANGLTEQMAAQIEAEYNSDEGISDASYAALAKAGYSKDFVVSYMKGQEAVAEQFVAKVVDYAGGQDKFQRIIKHMESTYPDAVESLYEAVERQDLKAIRAIINLGTQSHAKKFGKAPVKNVIKAAPAVAPQRQSTKAQGYESRSEMVKDMSSAAYRTDAKFRAKVEARVAASDF